jgi:hypothetical protein
MSGIGGSGAAGVAGSAGRGGGDVGGARGGAGGSADPIDGPADISGRWGMFAFEDPVGVLLTEASDGTLAGFGCAAGAPGSTHDSELLAQFCGQISGKVTGRTAWFAFGFSAFSGGYRADVTISIDGRRMAGDFNNGDPNARFSTAWLRVADDAAWLTGAPADASDALAGVYDLTLQPAASTGSEFTAGGTYLMRYFRHTLSGDLGSFWWSEMSDLGSRSTLVVGPVPATRSDLPTAVSLDFEASGFIRVSARTPSGGVYTFAASRRP